MECASGWLSPSLVCCLCTYLSCIYPLRDMATQQSVSLSAYLVHTYFISIYMHAACVYTCMYLLGGSLAACAHASVWTCIHSCMYICMYVCTYVRTYVCMYVCMHVRHVCHVRYVCHVMSCHVMSCHVILLPYIVPCFDGHVNNLARPGVTCAWYCIIFFGIIRCAPWLSGSRQGLLWQSLPRKKHRGHVRVWDFKVPCFRGIGLVVEV